MNQPKFAERLGKGPDSRDFWLRPEGWVKSEKLPFNFRKMFAAIALKIESSTIRHGYFCDVAMDVQVPLYLKGYPDILRELIYSLAYNILSQINNGGMVVKVDSVPVKNGESHLVTIEISNTAQGSCEQRAALEPILERYSEAGQYYPGDDSSWISWERQLKSPLSGRIMAQSLYGWGSRYKIEFELESHKGQGEETS